MKYFIKTFGCQQNVADSERVEQAFAARGFTKARGYKDANYVIVNTCMVRESAEERVYGLVRNLQEIKRSKIKNGESFKIIVTGCMVGIAFRDKTGKFLSKIRERMPDVDEFMPIEEVGFDSEPVRQSATHAWVPISNGCNNFCTFCIVPFTRGREISRPYEDIIEECLHLKAKGFTSVMLLGQNVNSYGADLILGKENVQVMRDIDKTYFESSHVILSNAKDPTHSKKGMDSSDKPQNDKGINLSTIRAKFTYNGRNVEPVYVKHLGKMRIPTLFPYLLEDVARMDFEKVDFVSSNPWDFSDELIDMIAQYPNITRTIHLPVQSGDNNVLKRMNRWYSREEYLEIILKLKTQIPDIKITTDIIVGFCGETDDEFQNTVKLAKEVGFDKAYISRYSERYMTAATKVMKDNVLPLVKKKRWKELDRLINTFAYTS
ncbi:MAG: radical SAM protein [Candidatus Roizmanbacteria bacterium]|nr:radical SAM protein [Candidatus Roizmanbacteria bacterium]